jgi:hypothetical protein
VFQQRGAVGTVLRETADADATGRVHGTIGQAEIPAQLPEHFLDGRGDVPFVGKVVEHQHELITAEPGDHVTGPNGGPQPPRDLDEQLVAYIVTERIVDILEPVEIDHDDRERDAPAAGRLMLSCPGNEPRRPGIRCF